MSRSEPSGEGQRWDRAAYTQGLTLAHVLHSGQRMRRQARLPILILSLALAACSEPPNVEDQTAPATSPSPVPELLIPRTDVPTQMLLTAQPLGSSGGLRLTIRLPRMLGALTLGELEQTVIWRRTPGAQAWGAPIAKLRPAVSQWDDPSVAPGQSYEYLVAQRPSSPDRADAFAMLQAGVDPIVHDRGKVILLVDDSPQVQGLATELAELERDLVGDGWTVLRHDVDPRRTAAEVKALIRSIYAGDPEHIKSLLIFGHVAVPYSGAEAFDGHSFGGAASGQHTGAWPADSYYGEVTSGLGPGGWSDSEVNDTRTTRSQNRNVPGDGKLDQDYGAPSAVELAVGRVDLRDMPAFGLSEQELLRQYLRKDHEYRHRSGRFQTPLRRRIVLTNTLGLDAQYLGNPVTAWTPVVGDDAFYQLDHSRIGNELHRLGEQDDALWSVAYDYGFFQGQNSITQTLQLAAHPSIKIPFHQLFGSYFGDWDNTDNYLRAPLCTQYGLGTTYGSFDSAPFGQGATVGETARRSSPRPVSFNWMGDPTLRLDVVAPPAGAAIRGTASGTELRWGSSPDSVLGYNVYRAATQAGPFSLVNTGGLVRANRLVVSAARPGEWFMVRAVRRELGGSGSYLNLSQGVSVRLGTAPATAPRITQEPASVQALEGRPVSFAVQAVGGGLSYQWFKASPGGAEAPLVGETRPALILSAVDASSQGTYRCEVRNAAGLASSQVVSLALHRPFGLRPLTITVAAGGSAMVPAFDPQLAGVIARRVGSPQKGFLRANAASPSGLEYVALPGFDGHDEIHYSVDDGVEATLESIDVEIIDHPAWTGLPGMTGTNTNGDSADLGGSSRVNGTTWEVRAFGHAYGEVYTIEPGDSLGYFEHQTLSGDFDVQVRLARVDGEYATVGLAIFDGSRARNRYLLLGHSWYGDLVSHYATTAGLELPTTEEFGPKEQAGTYLRLRRRGDSITRYASVDGVSWRQFGDAVSFASWDQDQGTLRRGGLPDALEVGLFVSGVGYFPGITADRLHPAAGPDAELSPFGRGAPDEPGTNYPAVAAFEGFQASAARSPLPALLGGSFVSEQVFRLEVSAGLPGVSYGLLASSDLRAWNRVASYRENGTGSATVSVAPSSEREFYRLQLGDDRSPRAFGFVRVVVPGRDAAGAGGTAMISNPLAAAGDRIGEVLPQVAPGTALWKWSAAGQAYEELRNESGVAWSRDVSFGPGEGGYVRAPGQQPLTISFVGEVLVGQRYRTIQGPLDVLGSMTPVPLTLSRWLPSWYETSLFRQDPGIAFSLVPAQGWVPSAPTLGVAEGLTVERAEAQKVRLELGTLRLP